jgi:Holliday junction resolvase RusA-like endonuclease
MTSRTNALRYPEGTKTVGTARVRTEQERVRNDAPEQPDDFAAVPAHEPSPIRSVAFVVAGEPVAKGRPRAFSSPTGIRMHTPKATKAYERSVQAAAGAAMRGTIPFGRPVALYVAIFLPIPASWPKKKQTLARIEVVAATNKPDADNVLKAIKDGMNGIVFEDDSQVVEVAASKKYGTEPRVEVRVQELDKQSA